MPEARTPQETQNIKTPQPGNDEGFPSPTGDIGPEVYRERRRKVLEQMGTGVAIIHAADSISTADRQNLDFYYLTGLKYEHGAALVLAPEHPQYQEQLFLRLYEEEDNRWHGNRPMLGRGLELSTGIARVMRTAHLPVMLNQAVIASKSRDLVYLGQFPTINAPVTKQMKTLQDISSRILNSSIRDGHDILPQLRCVHDEAEIAVMRKASAITESAHKAALKALKPGMNEDELMHVFEHAIRTNGCKRFAYEPIVGSGPNNRVLHYTANNRTMRDGEMVLCDVGAEFQMYASDVTRTYPVNGKFTDRQREIHDIVDDAFNAAVDMLKPGVTWMELNDKAREVIDNAGYSDQYYHSLGHFIGLDVHDVGNQTRPFEPGMALTIEPGVYIKEENIGVRTEDTILITETGYEKLTAGIPRSTAEIEAFMG